MASRILIAEDDDDIRFSISRALKKAGHELTIAADGAEAIDEINCSTFDLVITDLQMPRQDGLAVVRAVREQMPSATILVMTAFGTVKSAVEAMKAGADDYLQKPLSLEELILVAGRLIETASLRRRVAVAERGTEASGQPGAPIGSSPAWLKTMQLAARFAQLPAINRHEQNQANTGCCAAVGGALTTILITGETGTGKGVISRYIHDVAHRPKTKETDPQEPGTQEKDQPPEPFVHVNCSAIPPQLFESELFGHEAGAFTDAKSAREGLVEIADGGTLFLDEIGDLGLEMQSKLLIFLEQGRYRRVGGSTDRCVHCRVLAATNKDLLALSREGEFRADLYYRVSTFGLELPALRTRETDAIQIAETMVKRFSHEYRRGPLALTADARDAIARYPWPGNVRELINVIQRACMLAEHDKIDAGVLSLGSHAPHAAADGHHADGLSNTAPNGISGQAANGDSLRFDFASGHHTAQEVERELIIQALGHTSGNVARAARLVGMQRSSFRHRLEKYGIDSSEMRS